MSAELLFALNELEKDKGINKEVIIKAIEEALNTSFNKTSDTGVLRTNTRVEFNRETGEIKSFERKTVVEKVTNPMYELSLEEARKLDPEFEIDDVAEFEVTTKNFGRLAAQKAKQIIIQKIREEERNRVYEFYKTKEKDIVTGTVQRIENNRQKEKIIYVDLGKIEAKLLPLEQVPTEVYHSHERIKAYVVEVKQTNKDPIVLISRTHPGLVKRLFELEVPEIHDGVVEIKNIAREPGSRTKISVYSHDENVEPIGACVGQKGTRVQVIVDELRGERIDIIKWSPVPEELIASSLSPAKVVKVFADEKEKTATVIVPDHQLSLAIGKEGQNVRLAAKLIGWKIDIKSESQVRASIEEELFAGAPKEDEYIDYSTDDLGSSIKTLFDDTEEDDNSGEE